MSENSDNHQKFDKADTREEDENSFDLHRFNSQDTIFLSPLTTAKEINIAPGEGKELISILNDKYCEGHVVPCLFPKRKFAYKVELNIKLSQVKYFNQRLLNYIQIFASTQQHKN